MEKLVVKDAGKKTFSVVGFSFITLFVVTTVAYVLFMALFEGVLPDGLYQWLENCLPMYAIGFPTAILVLTRRPASKPQPQTMSAKQLLRLLPLCFCMMLVGDLLGELMSGLLSGGTAVNPIETVDFSLVDVVTSVILAPVMEELLCRKVLIDRIRVYGEKLTVLMSGLLFGLMHQNLFQFFYTFAIGCVFAYVYLRTGKLRYPVILHAALNFFGGVLGPMGAVLSGMDNQNPAVQAGLILWVVLFFGTYLGLSITGIVMLIRKRYKPQWFPAEQQLPRKEAMKATFLNVGMIIYLLLSVLMMGVSLAI